MSKQSSESIIMKQVHSLINTVKKILCIRELEVFSPSNGLNKLLMTETSICRQTLGKAFHTNYHHQFINYNMNRGFTFSYSSKYTDALYTHFFFWTSIINFRTYF